MNAGGYSKRYLLAAVFLMALSGTILHAQSATTIPHDRLVQPEAFNRELQADPRTVLILQVGSHTLFEEDHIPGAEYAGPASTSAGLEGLRTRVAGLPRDRSIVLYCGCCPWEHCPNVAAAWDLLQQMGFTNVRVLYIAHNFGADWVTRGFRAERSQ